MWSVIVDGLECIGGIVKGRRPDHRLHQRLQTVQVSAVGVVEVTMVLVAASYGVVVPDA